MKTIYIVITLCVTLLVVESVGVTDRINSLKQNKKQTKNPTQETLSYTTLEQEVNSNNTSPKLIKQTTKTIHLHEEYTTPQEQAALKRAAAAVEGLLFPKFNFSVVMDLSANMTDLVHAPPSVEEIAQRAHLSPQMIAILRQRYETLLRAKTQIQQSMSNTKAPTQAPTPSPTVLLTPSPTPVSTPETEPEAAHAATETGPTPQATPTVTPAPTPDRCVRYHDTMCVEYTLECLEYSEVRDVLACTKFSDRTLHCFCRNAEGVCIDWNLRCIETKGRGAWLRCTKFDTEEDSSDEPRLPECRKAYEKEQREREEREERARLEQERKTKEVKEREDKLRKIQQQQQNQKQNQKQALIRRK